MQISFGITACNEHKELDRLLNFLVGQPCRIDDTDEIVILVDSLTVTTDVLDVCDVWQGRSKQISTHTYPLDKDFASFKNHLSSLCVGDYILQIDADEIPQQGLIENIRDVIMANPIVDVYYIPRINTVEGITPQHIQQWGWRQDERGYINFPDYQMRCWKRKPEIQWKNKVHEVLTGYTKYGHFPAEPDYCLLHPKTIGKQEKQNNFYSTIG